uniref:Uncharacterized protein n=1 Tax=Picea sitchensis TaxID=3332 RepID=B8LN60_PICSI|nr:unknown [Picea sitchensis]
MTSRYGTFSRTARNLLMSNGRSTGASSSTTRPASASHRSRNMLGNDSSSFRQRCVKSLIPLHSAVASAKLVSHLSFNSRTGSALPLGLRGYVHILPLSITGRIKFNTFTR